ncbi:A-kinase anchor protein 13 isoform X2 [Hypomesus transpacificus]|uniref:A-kinase anchor protein 13 isoform X2 n=1 Tax=Hypomesus transpacificus TaxID=137520 RepID=UPI001F0739A4|nr:A-kinase anchor protein 13 isoform X2 [Hypomesus transpacificus]
MKLIPQQAPLYGKCLITVQLCEEEQPGDVEGVEFYLLFAGTTQSHITSALRSGHDILQALCPAHDCCEAVRVTLCSAAPGGTPIMVAHHPFSFLQDLAFDMAQFLVSTAGKQDGLEGALMLDECLIPLQECERLDQSLALALNHLTLPHGWSLLGHKLNSSTGTEQEPQETLLHFAARRGLRRVAGFLLLQPGAQDALGLTNKQGLTAACIAQQRGYSQLQELLTQAETRAETDRGTDAFTPGPATRRDTQVVWNIPSLDTHTLSVATAPWFDPTALQIDVEHLRHLICQLHAKGVSSLQLQTESLHTAQECCEGLETEVACLEQPRQLASPDTQAQGCEKENNGEGNDRGPSLATPTSECPPDDGQCLCGDRVCLGPNSPRDYDKAEEEEKKEGGEEEAGGVGASGRVSCSGDSVQSQSKGESLAVGSQLLPSCGKHHEESDTEGTVICGTPGAAEGTNQEGEERTAERDDEKHSDLSSPGGGTTTTAMGQTQSLENSESSDTDMECSQEGERDGDKEMEIDQNLSAKPHLEKDKTENKGLPDSTSPSMGLPPSPSVFTGDLMQEVPSDAGSPCPTTEGPRDEEPPSETNSLEQSQETAVGDYPAQELRGDRPDVSNHTGPGTERHSGEYAENEIGHANDYAGPLRNEEVELSSDPEGYYLPSNEPTDLEERASEPMVGSDHVDEELNEESISSDLLFTMATSEADLGAAPDLSSDEDTFRSVSSSLTEIFPLTEDSNITGEEGQEEDFDVSKMEASEEDTRDSWIPMELSSSVGMGLGKAPVTLSGTVPKPQPPPGHNTTQPWNAEKTPEPPLERKSAASVTAPIDQPVEVNESLCSLSEVNDPELSDHSEEIPLGLKVVEEDISGFPDPEGCETPAIDDEAPPPGTSFSSEVASAGEKDLPSDLRPLGGENSAMVVAGGPCDTTADSGPSDGHPPIDNISKSISDDVIQDLGPGSASSNSEGVPGAGPGPPGNQGPEEPSAEELLPDLIAQRAEGAPGNVEEASIHPTSPKGVHVSVTEEAVDGQADISLIHRDKEAAYPLPLSPCEQASASDSAGSTLSTACPQLAVCPPVSVSSGPRDSGSDTESFLSTDAGEDCVFRKGDDTVTGGDSTSEVSVSCSSTDDTASVGPTSSSPESCVEGQGLRSSWSPEEGSQPGANAGEGAGGGGETEEEAKDRLTEVPRRSGILRPSIRSLSPFRRHSWGPGKNAVGETDMKQRSAVRSHGEGKTTFHRRSMSWCPPEAPHSPGLDVVSCLSYSLEALSGERDDGSASAKHFSTLEPQRGVLRQHSEERAGSLVSLTEEHESDLAERSGTDGQKTRRYRPLRHSCPPMTLPLTKSVSMVAISQRDTDDMRSFSSTSGSLAYSISEEEPGPLRSDTEGKSGTKVSRTFSYLKSKMYKKTREKEREKSRDKEREAKDRDKRTLNGHLFTTVSSAHVGGPCQQCNKTINNKEAFLCTNCNTHVHKSCRENLPSCAKVKMKFPKQQFAVADSNTLPVVILRSKPTGMKERPRSAILVPEDNSTLGVPPSRRHTSIMPFNSTNLSKSISISNIAGPVFDDIPIKGRRYLSQSTDSLHKTSLVNESTESLTDEGTEMMDSQLMGEFEADVKELEADSWTFTVEEKFLKQLKKDVIKRQDVIYELLQTEMHHVRTLRIMSEVYSKGLQKEVQLEGQTVDRVLPVLDELLELHTQLFSRLLERKRDSQQEDAATAGGFVIHRIGDVLVNQFSGSNAECMKRVYGRFCSRHNEAVNFYKELLTKDKRFQGFIKKKMSSSIVRRLGIPECILLVTQRITKYPVLMQRILQHTNEAEHDHEELTEALRLVKEVLAAVDSKVNEHDKKRRLKEVYARTDSKSIMRMKSGQMFAREDLVRGRRLIHDGPLQLKNAQGRLKDVQAMLLSDVFLFLQEKDQKYVFASLDQRSTVISLQKLIVREVANEERGLFLITAGIQKPEMVEVLASTKDERNTWMQLIQDAMHSMDKDDDEGIPSETEEDKRQLETKAKEMRDMLRKKDEQIVALLEEKMKVFRDMCECGSPVEEQSSRGRVLFRASSQDVPRGEPIMKDALHEVETLQVLVNGSLGGAVAVGQQTAASPEAAGAGGVGPVCLPRRAETFGGFDSHQMNISKNGDKEEDVDTADLRRTESDSVLKKGGNANLLLLLKKNSEVLLSVTHLHDLLNTLQAVVVQQDTFIEDQRQALTERPPSSASSSSSRPSSRPNSLIEQEKQRSLEKHRQEMASLQRQQAAHAEEKRRREREWEQREQQLTDREVLLHVQEEETGRRRRALDEERQELLGRKEEYQKDLERLRDAQRKLDREREQVQREMERMEQLRLAERRMQRTPSSTSEDSLWFPGGSSLSLEQGESGELEYSSSLRKDSLSKPEAKPKSKTLNPFSVRGGGGQTGENQIPNLLLQLTRPKDKKEKKKKKGKGSGAQAPDSSQHLPEPALDGDIFYC